jgi:ribosomal protein S18 acetylase RimI-like enzyme
MPDPVADVHDAHVRRLAGIDRLVRVGDLDVTSDASVEWSPDGQAVVVGDVQETDPESEAGLWVEDRVVRLQVRAATDSAASTVTELLERGHAIAVGTTHVSVPSRDTAMLAPLVRAGFAPNAVLAVHRLSRSDVQPPPAGGESDSLVVRAADLDDLDEVVAANLAVQAFDAHVGSLPVRPGAERVIRPAVEKALRERPGWNWVAELDGSVVGVCQMEPPEDAQWVASAVAGPATAYLAELYVDPAARGRQVGARLVAAAHLRATAAGAQLVVLHHSAANPLSTPFWARAGYRPLVTGWARRLP